MAATMRRRAALVGAAALMAGALALAAPPPAGAAPVVGAAPGRAADERVEGVYTRRGTWGAMTADSTTIPGYTVYAPADLGAGGHRHAVVTWGNGTMATSDMYGPLFEHLTSWGYVIVAADDGWVGSGQELATGVRLLASEGRDPASRYGGTVDDGRVGAMGHSQGAGGALWAALDLGDAVDSYVGWALPDRLWWCFPFPWPADQGRCRENPTSAELAGLSAPALLVRASGDILAATAPGNRAWYDALPAPAARATTRAGDHTHLDGTIGYVTAWFRYTLDGDAVARAAFTGAAPEIAANTAWTGWAAKGLP